MDGYSQIANRMRDTIVPDDHRRDVDVYRDPAAHNRLREAYTRRTGVNDQAEQNRLGALEHGAFTEHQVRENPILGPLTQLALVPGYDIAKALGVVSGRSDPSLMSTAEGYRGIGRGVAANIGDVLNSMTGAPDPIAMTPEQQPLSQSMRPDQIQAMVMQEKVAERDRHMRELLARNNFSNAYFAKNQPNVLNRL